MENINVTIDQGGIALLELNRPDVLNALNAPLMREVRQALETMATNEHVRALIITGAGRAFCAGADLGADVLQAGEESWETLGQAVSDQMGREFNPMMEMIHAFPRPVITAVNGIAAGGGAGLALCADIVLASERAALKVVQPQQLGIAGDLGVNWLLSRVSGRARALGMCLLGDTVPAATLNQWGLVWDCVAPEELMARAMDIAGRLATLPTETVLATRRLVDEAPGDNFAHSLEKERELQKHLCDQPVFIESVRNFLDGC
jgi:2-(1,2-epoxy-1,2-dihydrophenyl)acetyl-CoA isomerase